MKLIHNLGVALALLAIAAPKKKLRNSKYTVGRFRQTYDRHGNIIELYTALLLYFSVHWFWRRITSSLSRKAFIVEGWFTASLYQYLISTFTDTYYGNVCMDYALRVISLYGV